MTHDDSKLLVPVYDGLTYLNIDDGTDADVVGFVLQSVSEMFDAYTDRKLLAGDYVEYLKGDGTSTIYVRNYPLNSTSETIDVRVDSDREFGADTQISDVWVDENIGAIVRTNGRFVTGRPIRVSYNGGYTAVPHDLQLAALTMMTVMYKERSEKNFSLTSQGRGENNWQYLDNLPHKVRETLRRYKRYG